MSVSYTFSGNSGTTQTIPSGIFTFDSSPLKIKADSTSFSDVGLYTFTVTVTDGLSPITSTFTLNVTNEPPILSTAIPDFNGAQK